MIKRQKSNKYHGNLSEARIIEQQCFFNANNKRCQMVKCSKCSLSCRYKELMGIRLEELEESFD